MKFYLKSLIVLCLLLLLQPINTSRATLVSMDLFTPGDKLLTLDTDTNLEWLDLTLTVGQTYDTVAGGFGTYTTALGFSFANVTQVGQLYTNAGFTDQTDTYIAGNLAGGRTSFGFARMYRLLHN